MLEADAIQKKPLAAASFKASSPWLNYGTVMGACIAFLLLSFVASLMLGVVPVSWADYWGGVADDAVQSQSEAIIHSIRLPRVLLAALIGALLGSSGGVTQGLFRNPLADPSLLGVTAGASAGGGLVIVFSIGTLGGIWALWLISFGAFVGGMAAVCLVYCLASRQGFTSVATMLLAGIAITALASSVTSLLEFVADNAMLRRISLWKMGGLDGANRERVLLAAVVCGIYFCLLPRFSTALNAFLLGESEARHLGINVEAVKTRLIILVAAAMGTAVALAGSIAFVGLVVPHIMRLLVGPNHRHLLPLSAVAGAILLILSDLVARSLLAPAELPVGLVTALIGAPFFIFLLLRRFDGIAE